MRSQLLPQSLLARIVIFLAAAVCITQSTDAKRSSSFNTSILPEISGISETPKNDLEAAPNTPMYGKSAGVLLTGYVAGTSRFRLGGYLRCRHQASPVLHR